MNVQMEAKLTSSIVIEVNWTTGQDKFCTAISYLQFTEFPQNWNQKTQEGILWSLDNGVVHLGTSFSYTRDISPLKPEDRK